MATYISGASSNGSNIDIAQLNFLQYLQGKSADSANTVFAVQTAARTPTVATKKATPVAKPAKELIGFASVIFPEDSKQQILDALEQVNQADLIFNVWGFGETIEKGKGVSFLFYGPPGTGKTLMAQAIANELKHELLIISTADIESSAPGEAERNIRRHFNDAKDKKGILLFDECDSLIYSRKGVGAILGAQINELLSQLERFDGVTIFTTNRLGTLDEAVNRRLALKLEFPMPTREHRAQIWQRLIPKRAPLANDINWHLLAAVEISGGYIKNAVLRAARIAAAEKVPKRKKKITMDHLVLALRQEAESMMAFEDAALKHERSFGMVSTDPVGLNERGRKVVRHLESTEVNA